MEVELVNSGPVTILLDSKKHFGRPPTISSLERIFVDPVETAIDQVELVAIHEL